MKKCYKCQEIKSDEEFCKNKRYKDGLHDICKTCKKEYNIQNEDKIKEYRGKTRKKAIEYSEKYRSVPKNREIMKKQNMGYYKNKTKEEIRENNKKSIESGYKKRWSRERYKNNLNHKLSMILRVRLLDALKGKANKTQSAICLLGCSIEQFKEHLENQFRPEMTWENHGEMWEVDHIISCNSFDLTDYEQQKQCFHYSNIQPLFKTTEIAKNLGYMNEIGNRDKGDK